MSDFDVTPEHSPRSEGEITAEKASVAEEKKRRRKKKKKRPQKSDTEPTSVLIVPDEEEQCVGMPQAWVDGKRVMAIWLLVTFLIVGLSIVTVPVGCLLAFVATFLYFSQRGTEEEFGGQYLARTIYYIAFGAWLYDMVIFTFALLAWIVLVYDACDNYDQNMCDFRVAVGYFVAAQMCMVFLHAVASFAAFLKMRDCCKDIILDEKEAKERFLDMEKQILAEFRRMRNAEHKPKRKKKPGR